MTVPMGGGHSSRIMRNYMREQNQEPARVGRTTLRRILRFARPYRKHLTLFLVLIAFGAAAGAVTPWLVSRLIDHGVVAGDSSVVITTALLMAVLAVVTAGLSVLERWISARIGEGVIRDLRAAVFGHVQHMSLAFFARARTGALVQRLGGDVLGAQQVFTSTLQSVVSNGLTVVFVLAAMLAMSWQLTLLSLIMLPAFIFPARWFGRRIARLTAEGYEVSADATQTMTERFNVTGAHLVKIFADPQREAATYTGQADQMRDIGVRRALYGAWFRVGLTTMAALAAAIVYGVGGYMAVQDQLTVGVIVALAAYLTRLYGPLAAMSNVQVDIMTALVSFQRVLEVLDLEPDIRDHPEATDLRDAIARRGASIEFDAVTFRYPGAEAVSLASLESVAAPQHDPTDDTLHDVSFTVAPGSLVALVGPSGAGKTTASHLATRMYDPTGGAIRIADQDLRGVSAESLRASVGVVSQEAHLFHDTIAGNLRLARPDARDAELEGVLRAAHIWDLVESLPDGIDTLVGDRGYRLSGGERQRLAIARLLLKAPHVVILDEATAHLDSSSEEAVQGALEAALQGRTSLVIAHRLSTVRHADLIVVLDEGRVVESGRHDDLLARGGLYADLARTQFATTTATA